MNRTHISNAIEQLQQPDARDQVLELDGLARSAAWWMFAASSQPPAHPPIGSFGRGRRGGNSAPDFPLVAGISNYLTLDTQREKAGFTHYGNRIAPGSVRAWIGGREARVLHVDARTGIVTVDTGGRAGSVTLEARR